MSFPIPVRILTALGTSQHETLSHCGFSLPPRPLLSEETVLLPWMANSSAAPGQVADVTQVFVVGHLQEQPLLSLLVQAEEICF